MSNTETLEEIVIHSPVIDPALIEELSLKIDEDAQVIVHCHYPPTKYGFNIRIWENTYLKPKSSAHRCPLVHFENISKFPIWTTIPPGMPYTFTLFFSALPKDCAIFDLHEEIPENGGFHVRNIERNESDIYHLMLA